MCDTNILKPIPCLFIFKHKRIFYYLLSQLVAIVSSKIGNLKKTLENYNRI